ncbi:hypothetical protein ACFL6U_18490, partial [Planctomycetota bacterium]
MMYKKLLPIILGFALTFIACDSKKKPTEAANEVDQAQQETTQVTNEADSLAVEQAAVVNTGAFVDDDLIFIYHGVGYPLHSDAGRLLVVLGKNYTMSQAPSCVYKGMDRQFIYDWGIEIGTYPRKDKVSAGAQTQPLRARSNPAT